MGVWEEWGCGGVVVWDFSPPEGEGKFFVSQLPLKKGLCFLFFGFGFGFVHSFFLFLLLKGMLF